MRATACLGVSMKSPEKIAAREGAGLPFTKTPCPLVRSTAAATSSAKRDAGKIAAIIIPTRLPHSNRVTPQLFRTYSFGKRSVQFQPRIFAGEMLEFPRGTACLVGINWLRSAVQGWHAFRRRLATNLHDLGVLVGCSTCGIQGCDVERPKKYIHQFGLGWRSVGWIAGALRFSSASTANSM